MVVVSNLSVGSGVVVIFSSRAHLTASARFRGRAPGPVSGRLCGTAAWRRRPSCPGFPSPFGRRRSLLGHPVPAGELGLPHGRLTGRDSRPDPDGVTAFRTHELRPGWVPSLPRGRRCSPGRSRAPTGACRFSAASPCTPPRIPPAGLLHEASTRVHAIHPSGLPSPVAARMGRAALRAFPGLRTPPTRPASARQGWDRQRARTWNYTLNITSILQSGSSLTTCDLASRRPFQASPAPER